MFTNVKSSLSISVEHATKDGVAAVVVFPRDPERWHAASSRIQFRAAASEPVTLEMLPPGDYLVGAIADVAATSLDPGNVSLLERLSPIAENVHVVEGTTTTVRVRPVALPQ